MSFARRYTSGIAALAGLAALASYGKPLNARDAGANFFVPGEAVRANYRQRRAQKPGDGKGLRRRTNRDHAKQRAKLR